MIDHEDYKIFFDDAPVALLRTDLETGRFLMANNFAANLFGCNSVQDLLDNKTTSDFYPDIARQKLIKKLKKNITLKEEIKFVLQNGKEIWVRANLRINCAGSYIEGYLTDITEYVNLKEKELIKLKCMSQKIDMCMAETI